MVKNYVEEKLSFILMDLALLESIFDALIIKIYTIFIWGFGVLGRSEDVV